MTNDKAPIKSYLLNVVVLVEEKERSDGNANPQFAFDISTNGLADYKRTGFIHRATSGNMQELGEDLFEVAKSVWQNELDDNE